MARGFAIACAAALGVLAVGPVETVAPLRPCMATLLSRRTNEPATRQAARDPAEPARASGALGGTVMTPPALDGAMAAPAVTTVPTGWPAAQRPRISSREQELIARARTAMAAGDVVSLVEARRLLEEHGRRFPRGRLAGEREAHLAGLR
jgi:RNA polymerase sigma-70 factor (ECF subfamily)